MEKPTQSHAQDSGHELVSASTSRLSQAQGAVAVAVDLLHYFTRLVAAQTGLRVRQQDRETLRQFMALRMQLLTCSTPEQYYQLLETDTPERHREWQELTLLLTNGETYFFRDQGQCAVLRDTILPQLIERRRSQRSLRIWSAGCSTGEEPYSLAMLVDALLPHRHDWHICILGTDLNSKAIEQAKQAVYSSWSFRMVHADLQRRYFHKRKTAWELDARIRTMVTLRAGNLLKDPFPSSTSDMHSMDLILCRNVFIYFDHDAVAVVIAKLTDTLRDGGYLMTGHNELHTQSLGRLQTRVFPEAVLYQRSAGHQACRQPHAPPARINSVPRLPGASAASSSPPLPTEPVQETTSQALLAEATTLLRDGVYAAAIAKAARVLDDDRGPARAQRHFQAQYLLAQAYANVGEHDKATHCCRQALDIDPFAVHPYYLLAHIAEEQGDFSAAKQWLQKVLYLAPASIAAHLELGALYAREHDAVRARKMRATALELLKAWPPDVPVEPYAALTAAELMRYVQKEIEG